MPIVGLSNYREAGIGDGGDGTKDPPYGPGGIYHEKQIGVLCAVHAVNNMLQGPVFDYSHFAATAERLDREEMRLLGDNALSDGSRNALGNGFFNVTVLKTVLEKKGFSFEIVTAAHVQKSDVAKGTAFILNKMEHWFAIRRIGEEWFDLNSCLKTPRHYNHADVRFHVCDAIKEGYTVFLVEGPFPRCALEMDSSKLVEAVRGCGSPQQGHSLFAEAGKSLGSGGHRSAAEGGFDAVRAARLARFGGGCDAGPPPALPEQPPAQSSSASLENSDQKNAAKPLPGLEQLVGMGFSREQAAYALEASGGNVEMACDVLVSSM